MRMFSSCERLLKIYTVCFLGHRKIDNPLAVGQKLYFLIRDLLNQKEYVEFILGKNGDFDLLAADVVRFAQNRVRKDNSELVLVQYQLSEDEAGRNYDRIEVCEKALKVHPKQAISERNKYMIDRSDMLVAYVTRPRGGAHQGVLYAQRKGKKVQNIAEDLEALEFLLDGSRGIGYIYK